MPNDKLIVTPSQGETAEAEALLKEMQQLIAGRGWVMADNPGGAGLLLAKLYPAPNIENKARVVGIVHRIAADGVIVALAISDPNGIVKAIDKNLRKQ